MNVLAICTASKSTLITINYQGTLITKKLEFSRHSENLFPLLLETLEEHNLGLKDFDCFGCVVGPGSFTGIRIGLSVIKGFAYANNKPVVAVNSLELLAYNLVAGNDGKNIIAVINAGAGLVYHQAFAVENGDLVSIAEPKVDKFKHFLGYKESNFSADTLVVYSQNGEKGEDYSTELGDSEEFSLESLARAIDNKIKRNEFTTAVEVSPLYLRVSQAEQNYRDLQFVRLGEGDISGIMRIESERDEGDLEWSEVALRQSFANPQFECFGLKNNEELLAIIATISASDEVEILRVKVKKSARLLGLGERLLTSLVDYYKTAGKTSILLEVNERNYPAISLYRKAGFTEVGRRPKYYHNKYDALLFNLDLTIAK